MPAFSRDGCYHLCHRAGFWDRIPGHDDIAEIGIVDIKKRKFTALERTYAWNFQQGSMLQWNPAAPDDEIIYNIRDDEGFRSIIYNINSGHKREFDVPVASIDPKGKYALSINFSRLFDLRPGYGYTGIMDKYFENNHPHEDGIFLLDLDTGKYILLISLDEIWDITGKANNMPDRKIVINHATFNTDGSRFVFFPRNFPQKGEKRETALITSDLKGKDICCIHSNYTLASHYHWKNNEELLIYADGFSGTQLYEIRDKTGEEKIVDREFFGHDGHCSYSPDRRWILYDSYPYSYKDQKDCRNIYLYDLKNHSGFTLNTYYSYPQITGDIRCDLHPRWNREGTAISFDSTHEGRRNVYLLGLEEFLKTHFKL